MPLSPGTQSGTFTPTLTFGGAAVGMTGTFNGYYTLIGNRCFFNMEISLSAKGSSVGSVAVGGLPFPNRNATNNRVALAVYCEGMTAAAVTAAMAYIGPNNSIFGVFNFNGTTAVSLTDASFTNTSDLMISGSYPIS